jgi:hypothetical protein
MRRLEEFRFVLERDPCLTVHQVLERQVGRVAAVAVLRDVLSRRLDPVEQRVHGHPSPGRVQLGPLRHAVDVAGDLFARQGAELVPRPAPRLVNLTVDGEVPPVQRGVRGRTCGQHRKVPRHVLARGYPVGRSRVTTSAKASRDDRHRQLPSFSEGTHQRTARRHIAVDLLRLPRWWAPDCCVLGPLQVLVGRCVLSSNSEPLEVGES